MTPSHTWIATADALAAAAARWAAHAEVALDTEFVFESTFRPRPGLVQFAAGGEIALVDAVALRDLGALGGLLSSPRVLKLVHAGAADVALLARLGGGRPAPLLDTQIAAAFCGLGASLSYGALVEAVTGVALSKSETRTDWTRRPLHADQLRYAAEDVAHLPEVAARLRERLRELGRLEWALEESAAVASTQDESEPSRAWRRVRGLGRLREDARRVARELAAWREREAERLDLARPFLLRDETLLALARREALPPEAARGLPGFDARRHGRHVESWGRALAAARAAAAAPGATVEPGRPDRELLAARERLGELVAAVVAEVALGLGLAAELLLARRQRERLVAEWNGVAPLAASLSGFRRELLSDALGRLDPPAADRRLFAARAATRGGAERSSDD